MLKFIKKEMNDVGTLRIILNRPEIHNAFNDEMIKEVIEVFKRVDDKVKLVVLTGEGKSFCAGADLNWMKSMIDYSFEENVADSQSLATMFEVIDECPVPVIGLINGAALGGGVGLVSVCDYVLAVESASLGFTEVNLGLFPAVISPYCMKKIGRSNAMAYFLSGERFKAPRAKEIGLIHAVCSKDEFNEVSKKLIDQFENLPADALRGVKNLVWGLESKPKDEIKDFTCNVIANQRISENGQEGMSALLEKRKPTWKKI